MKLSMSKSSVARLAKRLLGEDIVPKKAGRKSILSSRQRSLLVRGISKRLYTSATEASTYWLRHHQLRLSRQTITRAFLKAGLKLRVKRRKPILNHGHRKRRKEWAERHRAWTLFHWKNVIWSDECMVRMVDKGGDRRYWSRKANYDINIPTLQGGGASVMIWGCMSWAGLGLMVFIDGSLDSNGYCDLLEEALPGSLVKWKQSKGLPPRNRLIFQQDNASCHTSRMTKDYLNDVGLNVMKWPAMSPDLNPIEHVWQQLKKRLYKQRYTIKNKADLKAAISTIWEQFPLESVRSLIKSMPRRLDAVRRVNGGHTKY